MKKSPAAAVKVKAPLRALLFPNLPAPAPRPRFIMNPSSSSSGGYHSGAAAFASPQPRGGGGGRRGRGRGGGGWRGGRGGGDGSDRVDGPGSSSASFSSGYHSTAAPFDPPQPRGGGGGRGRGGGGWRGGYGGGNGSEYVDASGSSASSSSAGYHHRAATFTPPQPRGGDGWGGRGGGGWSWRGGRGGGNGRDRVDALGSSPASSSSSAGYHSTVAAFSPPSLPRGGDGRGGRGGRNGSDRADDLCSASTSSGGYHTTAAVRGGGRVEDLCSSSTSSGGYHTTDAAFTPPQPRGGWGGLGRGGGGGCGGRGGGDVSDIVKALGSLSIGSSGGNHSRPAASTASQPRGGGRGCSGGEASNRVDALGRLMTRVLRHLAAGLGLDMRTDGYVRVRDLLRLNLRTYANVPLKHHTVDEVREAVKQNSKQRLSLLEEDGELLIRANQGHSITTVNSENLLKPILSADEVSICVHGTFRKKLNSILQSGLNRMSRLHVHFSSGLPSDGEIISGVRKNVNILIHLDIRKALQDGMKLYVSDNNVILTEGFDGIVPVKYFEKIETWPRRAPIPFER